MPNFGFLSGWGPWGVLALFLLSLAFYLVGDLHKNEKARGPWVARLRHDGFTRRYKRLLAWVLDRSDAWLSPPPDFSGAPDLPKTEPGRAWSWRLLDFCLLIAVAYPILSVLVAWAWTGDDGRLAELVLIPAEASDWRRGLAISLLVGVIWSLRRAFQAKAFLTMLAYGFAALAGALAFGGAFAFADTFLGAFAVAGPFTFAGAFVLGSAFAFAFAFAFAVAGANLVPVAGAVAGAGVVAVAGAQLWAGRRFGRPGLALFLYSVVLFGALVAVVRLLWEPEPGRAEDAAALVLFLGFLPLLNAWANFLSAGLTRWFLRWGLQGNLLRNALADAIFAVGILLLLAFALIATVHWVRPAGNAPLFDLRELFAHLRGPEASQYYWLYFCFFATLLPTVLHLNAACFGLFTLLSGRLGYPIAAGLMAGDTPTGRFASLALAVCMAAALWVPCFLIWLFLVILGRPILDAILWICEWFARLIGAI